jgi:hypothetical protein
MAYLISANHAAEDDSDRRWWSGYSWVSSINSAQIYSTPPSALPYAVGGCCTVDFLDAWRRWSQEPSLPSRAYVVAGRAKWFLDGLDIDDKPAVSVGEDGAWVQAWVWVGNDDV